MNTDAFTLVSIPDGISEVIGGNTENTLREGIVPAVLPHQLAKMRPRYFSRELLKHREHWVVFNSEEEVDSIET